VVEGEGNLKNENHNQRKSNYINYMYNHLRKEHPATRKRMTKTQGGAKMNVSEHIEERLEHKRKRKRKLGHQFGSLNFKKAHWPKPKDLL
jgi:hypothetical protein